MDAIKDRDDVGRLEASQGSLLGFAAALLLGLVAFLATIGPGVLDVTDTDWLRRQQDLLQHYVGWAAYRWESWQFPLGAHGALNAPAGTSIVYTDSLPLFAIPAKLLSGVLPVPFQYQGLWLLTCWLLQPAMAYWFLRRSRVAPLPAVLGAALFLLFPPLYMRYMFAHEALAGQWLILWALVAYQGRHGPGGQAHFFAVLAVAAAVHFYLLFMALAVWAAWWMPALVRAGGGGLARLVRTLWQPLLALSGVLGVMWGLGYFVVSGSEAGGFGYYSMNLLAPVNPMYERWSTLLPVLPWRPGQQEGFQYLGAGLLLLLAGGTALWLRRPPGGQRSLFVPPLRLARSRHAWLALACLALAVLAVSDVVVAGEWVLLSYEMPLPLIPGLLRSSGRLFWLVSLAGMAGAVVVLARRLPPRAVKAALAVVIAVQLVDIHRGLAGPFLPEAPPSAFADPRWESIVHAADVLKLYEVDTLGPRPLLDLVDMAMDRPTRVNEMYLARFDPAAREARREADKMELLAGRLDPGALYLGPSGALLCLMNETAQARARMLDGMVFIPPQGAPVDDVARPVFPLHRAPAGTTELADLLRSCGPGCSLLLAVRDEATLNLADDAKAAMRALGGRLDAIGYRDAYAAVVHDGRVVAEAMGGMKETAAVRATVGDIPVYLSSAGAAAGNRAVIEVAGQDCSENRRGINAVRIDHRTGAMTRYSFDTHAGVHVDPGP